MISKEMAGILFVDGQSRSVLAGFHPKLNRLSGFGGKRKDQETAEQTAVREVVEELFGVFALTTEHVTEFSKDLGIPRVYDGYSVFVEPIETVFKLSAFLSKNGYFSPFYSNLPVSVSELIYHRIMSKTTEVTDLSLFAIRDLGDMRHMLTSEFYEDISTLLGLLFQDASEAFPA